LHNLLESEQMSERAASVIHVDLDAFFVSMELLRRPELRGLPVAVSGGLGPRSVVSTASYEARRFGVRSAMPVSRARALCPHAVFLTTDFAYYAAASRAFHEVLRRYTPVVEPAGADEAYLDVAGSEALFGAPEAIAADIRRAVREEIGITASAGVSRNKLVSKVASDAAKPDGLLVVAAGTEATFLAPRPIRDLPMVGRKTAEALAGLGVHTIGDIARMPVSALVARFGTHGAELHTRALGIYDAPVLSGRSEAKSVSREATFDRDEPDGARLRAVLLGQAEHVAADLVRHGRAGRTVTLKLRFPPFETISRSTTTTVPVQLAAEIHTAALALFNRAWAENNHRPVRLVGLGVSNLHEPARQLRLGESLASSPARLQETVHAIRDRFGDSAVRRAAELPASSRASVDTHRPRPE